LLYRHSIHPALVSRKQESEIDDMNAKWIRMEPNDIVADCIELVTHSQNTTQEGKIGLTEKGFSVRDSKQGSAFAEEYVNLYRTIYQESPIVLPKAPSNQESALEMAISDTKGENLSSQVHRRFRVALERKREDQEFNLMRVQLLLEHYIMQQHVDATRQCKRQLAAKEAHMIERSNLVSIYSAISESCIKVPFAGSKVQVFVSAFE
jgi:hypothetical protein